MKTRLFIAVLFLSLWCQSALDRGLTVKPGLENYLEHWQTVQTQIRCSRMLHLTRVWTVCLNYRKLRVKWNSLKSQVRTIFSAYTIATHKRGYPHNIFLISWRKHILLYSLEVPHRGASNEYPQHMFSLRNKKDISIFRMKNASYLLLCYTQRQSTHQCCQCFDLTLVLLNLDIPCLCKQCRSRSVGFWRSQLIWIYTVCHSVCEIYINNPELVIWLAENWKWAWHLNLFSKTRVNTIRYVLASHWSHHDNIENGY